MKPRSRPTLEETYAVATGTSDLSLPHGDAAGAQGILAAAAWTEVTLGSALRRLRTQWENARLRKKAPRPVEVLRSVGLTREQARRVHNREKVQFALTFYQEKKALRRRIPEYDQVRDQLTVHAALLGIEGADTKAAAVLDRWLEDPRALPDFGVEGEQLRTHLNDCMNRARAALQQGVRGHTKHEIVDE